MNIGDEVRIDEVYGRIKNVSGYKGHKIYQIETVLEPGVWLLCDVLESHIVDLNKEAQEMQKEYEK